MEILCSFRLVLEGKLDKEIPKSSRLEFLEKILANNFTLLDANNTAGLLNRSGIADLLCWEKFQKSIRQKSWESSFLEMIAAANLIYWDIFFSSLVSFTCFWFFFLFVCLLFFEIKNAYSDTHFINRVGEWFFTWPISGS